MGKQDALAVLFLAVCIGVGVGVAAGVERAAVCLFTGTNGTIGGAR